MRAGFLLVVHAALAACGTGADSQPATDAAAPPDVAPGRSSVDSSLDAAVSDARTRAPVSDASNAPDTTLPEAGADDLDVSGRPDVPVPLALPGDGGCLEQPVDAAPMRAPCAFAISEVVCDASSDCTWTTRVSCCGSLAVGVNRTNITMCPPPPCPPGTCPDGPGGFVTEYCQSIASTLDIAVACVQGRCVSYLGTAGSE